MKDILNSAYSQICSKVITRENFLIGSHQIIKWIPLLLCWSPDKYIGISEIGEWVVEEESGLRILIGPSSLVRVKILLEQPIETIRKQLRIYSDNIDIEDVFPFLDIIQGVLEDGFEYWMELAFVWYDNLPLEKKLR